MGEEIKRVVGELGYERAQDLVGRYDLLEQISHADRIDLAELITPLEEYLDLAPADLPAPVAAEEILAEARAEAGLVVARPIRMERKEASAELARLAADALAGTAVRREYPRPTDTRDRVPGTELARRDPPARVHHGA